MSITDLMPNDNTDAAIISTYVESDREVTTDRIVTEPDLTTRFLADVRRRLNQPTDGDLLKRLVGLRKGGYLVRKQR